MYKSKLIPVLAAIILLTGNVYAAEPADGLRSPDSVQTEDAAITITDITPQENAYDGTLPDFLPLDVQVRDEDGVKLLVKTYEVSPDILPQQLIESGLTRNGVGYILREVLRQTLPGSVENREASQSVTVASESDKREDILPLLPEILDFSENGYTGTLTLVADSITTEVESTSGYTYTLNDTKEYYGLERNDPYYIPKTTIKNGVTLSLTDVKWTPAGGNENLVAPTFTATAYYTGKASGSKADGYLVTARYSGPVEKAVPGNILYSIVYEAVPVPIIPSSFDWGQTGLIALLVVGSAGIVVLGVFIFRKVGKLPRLTKRTAGGFDEYQSGSEARPVRRKPHALGYMKRDGGTQDA